MRQGADNMHSVRKGERKCLPLSKVCSHCDTNFTELNTHQGNRKANNKLVNIRRMFLRSFLRRSREGPYDRLEAWNNSLSKDKNKIFKAYDTEKAKIQKKHRVNESSRSDPLRHMIDN